MWAGSTRQRFRSRVALVFTASRKAPAAVGPARVDKSDGGRVEAVAIVVCVRSRAVLVENNGEALAAGGAVPRLEPSPAGRTPRTRTRSGLRGRNLRAFRDSARVIATGRLACSITVSARDTAQCG